MRSVSACPYQQKEEVLTFQDLTLLHYCTISLVHLIKPQSRSVVLSNILKNPSCVDATEYLSIFVLARDFLAESTTPFARCPLKVEFPTVADASRFINNSIVL